MFTMQCVCKTTLQHTSRPLTSFGFLKASSEWLGYCLCWQLRGCHASLARPKSKCYRWAAAEKPVNLTVAAGKLSYCHLGPGNHSVLRYRDLSRLKLLKNRSILILHRASARRAMQSEIRPARVCSSAGMIDLKKDENIFQKSASVVLILQQFRKEPSRPILTHPKTKKCVFPIGILIQIGRCR